MRVRPVALLALAAAHRGRPGSAVVAGAARVSGAFSRRERVLCRRVRLLPLKRVSGVLLVWGVGVLWCRLLWLWEWVCSCSRAATSSVSCCPRCFLPRVGWGGAVFFQWARLLVWWFGSLCVALLARVWRRRCCVRMWFKRGWFSCWCSR